MTTGRVKPMAGKRVSLSVTVLGINRALRAKKPASDYQIHRFVGQQFPIAAVRSQKRLPGL
jgi:hypothetical protein